jgi:hypothetical protein
MADSSPVIALVPLLALGFRALVRVSVLRAHDGKLYVPVGPTTPLELSSSLGSLSRYLEDATAPSPLLTFAPLLALGRRLQRIDRCPA